MGPGFFVLLLTLVALSATQDIAVDGYTIEIMDRDELGPANGTRVMGYRIGMIVAGGVLVAASGPAGVVGGLSGRRRLYALTAALTSAMPEARREHDPQESWIEPLRELLARPGILVAALFVLSFKLGDLALTPMVKPFWVDSGYTVQQIGWVQTTLGVGASIVGALLGGEVIRRLGAFKALWVLGLVQALSNLTYWLAAVAGATVPLMYSAAIVEQFTAGLGTAAFLTFLMTLVVPQLRGDPIRAAYRSVPGRWDRRGRGVGHPGRADGIRVLFPADLRAGPAGLRAAALDQGRGGEGLSRARIHRATASCISRCRCQARRTGASLGSCSTSLGCPKRTMRSASVA